MAFRHKPPPNGPPSVAREVDEELAQHLRRRAEDLIRAGQTQFDAHRQALAEFGDLSAARRELIAINARIDLRLDRAEWWSGAGRDLWLGARRLARQPLSSAIMVLTLGLAIGATTAVFSVVDQTVLRPPPFPHADRLVDVFETDAQKSGRGNSLTPPKIAAWQQQPAIFERLEAYAPRRFDLTGAGEPERVQGRLATLGLFDMLGVVPLAGRSFTPGDGATGSERVAMIGEGLWRRRFGSDPAAVGARLLLNDQPYTIVGVIPQRFRLLNADEEIWLPVDVSATDPNMSGFYGLGRLARGLQIGRAQAAIDDVAERMQRDTPLARAWSLLIEQKRVARVDEAARQVLFVLLGAVGCLLLIACANVTSVLLGQSTRRDRETGLRSALGASRARLMREALAEGLVLAAAGGTIGWLMANWLVAAVVAAAPADLAFMTTAGITLDRRVLIVAALVTAASGLLCGLLPALRASRRAAADALRNGLRATSASNDLGRGRGLLVVSEIACSVVLLVGALLMTRTIAAVYSVDAGFEPAGLISMRLDLPSDRYPTSTSRQTFLATVREQLLRLPGVSNSAMTTGVPPDMGGYSVGIPEAEDGLRGEHSIMVMWDRVSASYFQTVGVRLLAGRSFATDDLDDVVIVGADLARQFWPDGGVIGKRFRLAGMGGWRTVVGIAGQVEARAAHDRTALQVYFPWAPRAVNETALTNPASSRGRSYTYQMLIVRAEQPGEAVAAMKAAIWTVDPLQPVERVALVSDLFAEAFGRERFVFLLMTVFGGTALVLSAAGLFGLLSQAVAERRREIGVRMALGARPVDIARLVMGRGLALSLAGVGVGLAAATLVTQYLGSVLFAVGPHDVVSFGSVVIVLFTVAICACWLPTRTALGLDPAHTLRAE